MAAARTGRPLPDNTRAHRAIGATLKQNGGKRAQICLLCRIPEQSKRTRVWRGFGSSRQTQRWFQDMGLAANSVTP